MMYNKAKCMNTYTTIAPVFTEYSTRLFINVSVLRIKNYISYPHVDKVHILSDSRSGLDE
jgi:hypothetical protein